MDDEQVNLFLFERNFEDSYSLFLASSGPEALDILEDNHQRIIVVISDYKMPDMNGLEFIMKAKSNYQKIVYFMLTGYGDSEDIQKALEDGVIFDCFRKPLSMEAIEKKIDEATLSML